MIQLLIISLLTTAVWSSSAFRLKTVNVECISSLSCTQRTARLKSLEGEYRNLTHLKDTLKVLASDGGYKSFYYQLEESGGENSLLIRFSFKPTPDVMRLV